jgi:putative membrane protein
LFLSTGYDAKSHLVPADKKSALPTALDDSSQKKLDNQYDPMQVSAHKDAVSLLERYAKGGEGPKLKDWAGKTLPALQHHLEMAQALDKKRK